MAVSLTSVFLSSTSRDLARCREAAFQAIRRLKAFRCVQMEDWGAMRLAPVDACRKKISECEVVVVVAGHYFGGCPGGSEKSFTQCEYEAALQEEKDVLVFLAADDFPVPANIIEPDELRTTQHSFRRRLERDHVRERFSDEGQLAEAVLASLANWREEKYGVVLQQTSESRQVQVTASGLWLSADDQLQKMAASLEALNQRLAAIESGSVHGQDAERARLTDDIEQLKALHSRRLSIELSDSGELPSPMLRELAGRNVSTLAQLFDLRRPKHSLRRWLPGTGDANVVRLIADRLDRLLDVDISEILFCAWRAEPQLAKVRDRQSHTVHQTALVSLADHIVDLLYKPDLRLRIGEIPVAVLRFEVQLSLRVSGFVLAVQAGEIVEAHGGRVGATGMIKLEEHPIAQIETAQVAGLGAKLAPL